MVGGSNNGTNGTAHEVEAIPGNNGGDPPCEGCGGTSSFDIKSKALELSVSYCQTEALLEITKMNKGEQSFGVPSPNSIIKRAKQFEEYLNDESE